MAIQRYECLGFTDKCNNGDYVLHFDHITDKQAEIGKLQADHAAEVARLTAKQDALDKENIVMRQQMERLIAERDAAVASRDGYMGALEKIAAERDDAFLARGRAEEALQNLERTATDLYHYKFPHLVNVPFPTDHPIGIAIAVIAAAQDAKPDHISQPGKMVPADSAMEPGQGGQDCTTCQHDSNACDRAECPQWGGPEGEE